MTTLYKAVKLDSTRNTVDVAAAVTDLGFGITQQTAVADEAVAVKKYGYSLAQVGTGGWTKGAKLTPDTAGVLIATTTAGDKVCAIAMEAANAAELGEVYILDYPIKYSSF